MYITWNHANDAQFVTISAGDENCSAEDWCNLSWPDLRTRSFEVGFCCYVLSSFLLFSAACKWMQSSG